MWHEARKQEKKIRGMLVDYRKRAERRQHFYERIKAEPTQFLQVHGRKCKIHLDASVAAAAENPAIMMPWQGQRDNLIDRFDVRAHLDYIAPAPRQPESEAGTEPLVVEDADERSMNYERFRVLAQNEFLGIVEEKYLHQLYLEEQFGVNAQVEAETKAAAAASKKKSSAGAAIGYTYEETEIAGGSGGGGGTGGGPLGVGSSLSSSGSVPFSQSISAIEKSAEGPSPALAGGGSGGGTGARFDECMKDESDSDLDMDVSIDINKIGTTQAHELNACGRQYGMQSNDFYSFLTKDADEADALRMAREEEQEKIMFSGRKSRRERRAQRERKFAGRPLSPPSYAAKEELVPRTFVETNDSSRSPSPVNSGKITYITSFGGEDELQAGHGKISFGFSRDMSTLGGIAAGTSKAVRLRSAAIASGTAGSGGGGGVVTYAEKVKQNLEKLKAQEPKVIDRKPPVQYQRQASTGRGRRRSASSSSGSSRRGGRRSRARRRPSSSSSSSSGSSSSSRSRKRGRSSKSPVAGRRTRRLPDRGGRSRSPSKGRRTASGGGGGGRHAAHSRSHRRRSKSNTRSRSRSRSRSRTRWSPPARRRSPRYGSRTRKGSPKRSSSSSTSSSRSRSRTPPSHTRTQTATRAGPSKRTVSGSDSSDSSPAGFRRKLRTQTAVVPQEKKKPTMAAVITPAILSTLPLSLLPPPPPPPLPPSALSTSSEPTVEDKKPTLPPLALIEPEPLVPIKRYYGRRRGDESSTDDGSSSGEDASSRPSTVEDRKPVIAGLLHPDTGCVDDTAGSSCKIPGGELGGMVQIKQEKPDTNLMATDPLIASGGPAGSGEGLSASLRFGKTVPGGTGASESKAGILSSGTTSTTSSAATVSGAPHSKTAFNPRDRLKRKMQILLNKQYKADKKAEIEKVERQIQQQQERDDEMRELALKLRRRQRELRHKYGTQESDRSKSHTSDERSSGDEDEPPVSMGQPRLLPPLVPPVRYAQLTGREGSCSPHRQPLLAAPHQSSVQSLSAKMPSHQRQTSASTRSEGFAGTGGYRGGSSAVIERKPVLRSDSSSMQATALTSAAPPSLYAGSGSGGDLGRLRRRNSPTPLVSQGGSPFRGQPSGAVPTHSMNLRRAGGGGGSGGPPAPGGRFDDRTRRRTPPARFNRSRSNSRERERPSGRDVGGGGGRMTGRRMDYGRSRDYDRYHGSGGGGPQSGFSASSGGGGGGGGGGGSGRYRGARRSRSGSRGRRSRSPGRRSRSPSRGRGNGGGSSSHSGSTSASRQTESKPVKKLVDY
ncbi:serine/arginine repetitive matrix protein 2-like [Anopheles albimanus]|uniref:Suppressor of white apricot N-terminal domain-containing protein n=1 Tax=Anopheles albimanus TaxID=7167 RepID=A0A8W7JZQ7_ANOAL|nr:serine/arginine repetitive matrix protein 2-like [Anopheles albimanus]